MSPTRAIPQSYTAAMLGWLRAATPRIDSSNRSRNEGGAASLGRTSLSVTVRPDSSSRASNTAALAPVETTRRTRNRSANRVPTRSAGSNARGGDVSPGTTMSARYRLTPIRRPHSETATVCRSGAPNAPATRHHGDRDRGRDRRPGRGRGNVAPAAAQAHRPQANRQGDAGVESRDRGRSRAHRARAGGQPHRRGSRQAARPRSRASSRTRRRSRC